MECHCIYNFLKEKQEKMCLNEVVEKVIVSVQKDMLESPPSVFQAAQPDPQCGGAPAEGLPGAGGAGPELEQPHGGEQRLLPSGTALKGAVSASALPGARAGSRRALLFSRGHAEAMGWAQSSLCGLCMAGGRVPRTSSSMAVLETDRQLRPGSKRVSLVDSPLRGDLIFKYRPVLAAKPILFPPYGAASQEGGEERCQHSRKDKGGPLQGGPVLSCPVCMPSITHYRNAQLVHLREQVLWAVGFQNRLDFAVSLFCFYPP